MDLQHICENAKSVPCRAQRCIDFVYYSHGNIDSLVMTAEKLMFTWMSIHVLFKSSLS